VNKTVYFFLTPNGVSRDNYAHTALVLAEGLQELGWQIFANIDYWRSGPDETATLFRNDPAVQPSDCAINVLTHDWLHFLYEMPYEFVENRNSVRVYLEDTDWMRTSGRRAEFGLFDIVLKPHFNSRTQHPPNYRPWAFGLTRRILAETAEAAPYAARRKALLVNFGATHDSRHELRDMFEARIYPGLQSLLQLDRATNNKNNPPVDRYHRFMWEQTAWRHYPDYYERLRNSVACACVGGQFFPASPDDWSLLEGGARARLRRLWHGRVSRLRGTVPRWNQWESWRFWESMSAGCAALMLDFEKYGVQLPVQPENWKHYIGFDLDNLSRDLERLTTEPHILSSVGAAGRAWVLEHYAPGRVAEQFLKLIGNSAGPGGALE